MKNIWKRIGAWTLGLCLLAGTARGGMEGLDEALSGYFDVNEQVNLAVGFQLKTLLPFEKNTLDMMNGALKHLRMDATLGDVTSMSLLADGEKLLDLTERTVEGGGTSLTTSLLPNRTLTASGSALDKLFADGQGEAQAPFDLQTAISEAEECYQALTDAISPYATEKKANYKIAGVGYAKWVRLAKLTPEQSATLLPQLIKLLGCGMDDAFKAELAPLTCKKDFTIALYQTQQNGDDLSVYIKGNVSLGENDNRTLAYQWSFSRAQGKTKDLYKLELIKGKAPVNRRIIEASLTKNEESDKLDVALSSSVTLRDRTDTRVLTEKHSLKSKASGNKTTLTGTATTTEKTTVDGDSQTLSRTWEPNLTLTSAEGSGVLSGSVKVAEKQGKVVQKELTVLLDDAPAQEMDSALADGTLYAVADGGNDVSITIDGSSLSQNADVEGALAQAEAGDSSGNGYLVGQAPVGMTAYAAPGAMGAVNLDTASESELAALRDELAQNAAGHLLIALSKLEGEDGKLLADNMTDEDLAALLGLMEGL